MDHGWESDLYDKDCIKHMLGCCSIVSVMPMRNKKLDSVLKTTKQEQGKEQRNLE